jgi:hypothetical protein
MFVVTCLRGPSDGVSFSLSESVNSLGLAMSQKILRSSHKGLWVIFRLAEKAVAGEA